MNPTITLLGITAQTYTLIIGAAAAISIALTARTLRQTTTGAVIDVCVVGLLVGLAGARLAHVLIHWNYFADHIAEAWTPRAGGLDWHGGLIGGLIGLWIGCRLRSVDFAALLRALTPALPLMTLAGWWGCAAAACAVGAEVDTLARYPALVVIERGDVFGIVAPRWNTHLFGGVLAALLMLGALVLARQRFWGVALTLSAGMFMIGFVRADAMPSAAGLSIAQWLDLAVGALCLTRLIWSAKTRKNP